MHQFFGDNAPSLITAIWTHPSDTAHCGMHSQTPSSGCLTLWETVDGSAPYKHRSPWITRCASKHQRIQSGYAGYLLSPVAFQEVLGTLDNAANHQQGSSEYRGDRSSQTTDRTVAYQMPEHFQTLDEETGRYVCEKVIAGTSV